MRQHLPAAALALLGTAGMIGHLLDVPAIKGLAAATTASPAPKVFSAVEGLETYSTSFAIEWTDDTGAPRSIPLDAELYAELEGPYNRRNVYGAVLAFGPVLASKPVSRTMFESVLRYAACGDRPLLRELGLNPAAVRDPVIVRVTPAPGVTIDHLPLVLEAPCR